MGGGSKIFNSAVQLAGQYVVLTKELYNTANDNKLLVFVFKESNFLKISAEFLLPFVKSENRRGKLLRTSGRRIIMMLLVRRELVIIIRSYYKCMKLEERTRDSYQR